MNNIITCLLIGLFTFTLTAKPKGKFWVTYESAKAENPDFLVQGEYGSTADGFGVQVVALGDGTFEAYFLEGGLPGDGWDKTKKRVKAAGKTTEGVTTFESPDVKAAIKDGKISGTWGDKSFDLKRIERESPTLGQKAPEGAVILFDGKNADAWENGKIENETLMHGTTSKQKFQSYKLHIEFLTPYRPFDRGQGRGNSGVYHQGRYETQVLDSFGLEGQMNETGGIYSISKPSLNMCFPPLRWQTYDVEFTAAKFENGAKVKNATLSVWLNGVQVQENIELPKTTTAAPVKENEEPGPIYLQNHDNPVFYRNIWILEKK